MKYDCQLVGMVRSKNGLPFLKYTLEQMTKIKQLSKIVLFDDHSTDGTKKLCKNYSKIHYIPSPFDENDYNEARDREFVLQEAKKFNPKWICFKPGQYVRCVGGYKKIEDIVIGEMVLTHEGRFKRVLKTFKNEYHGKMKRIFVDGNNIPIECTPEHPFFAILGHNECRRKQYCMIGCVSQVRMSRKDGLCDGNCKKPYLQYKHDWIGANKLKHGDFLLFKQFNTNPVNADEISDIEFNKSEYNGNKYIDSIFKIKPDNDLMRLFGYYLAEGFCGENGTIGFAFNENEKEYHQDVIDIMKSKFNLDVHYLYRPLSHCTTLRFNCKWLSLELRRMFGTYSWNKTFPDIFLSYPNELLFNLFYGWYLGDGSFSKSFCNVSSVSVDLILKMKELLYSLGVSSSVLNKGIRGIGKHNAYSLCTGGNNVSILKEYGLDEDYDLAGWIKLHTFMYKDYVATGVREVTDFDYDGYVYNLEVEDDNSYSINQQFVHNCTLDSDEIFEEPKIYDIMDELLNPTSPQTLNYVFPLLHLWNDPNHWNSHGLWGQFHQSRLFRNMEGQHIETGEDGSTLSGCTPWFAPFSTKLSLLRIKHYGNMLPETRKKKYDFYSNVYKTKGVSPLALGKWEPFYKELYKKEKLDPEDYIRHLIDPKCETLHKWADKVSISLNVIAKNNEADIGVVLSTMKPLCDEIVVVDTGSQDKTKEIAKSFGAKVIETEWKHDFSHPRNLGIENSTKEVVLRVDTDEIFMQDDLLKLYWMACAGEIDAYIFPVKNFLESPAGNPNAKYFHSQSIRMFRRHPGLKYTGIVHEEIDKSIVKAIKNPVVAFSPVYLLHSGYLNSKEYLEKKFDYYYKLCLKEIANNPKDFYSYHSIAVHMKHIGKIKESREYFEKSLEIEPRAFLSYAGLAELAEFEGNFDLASEMYEKACTVQNPLRTEDLTMGYRKKIFEMKAKKELEKIKAEELKYLESLKEARK